MINKPILIKFIFFLIMTNTVLANNPYLTPPTTSIADTNIYLTNKQKSISLNKINNKKKNTRITTPRKSLKKENISNNKVLIPNTKSSSTNKIKKYRVPGCFVFYSKKYDIPLRALIAIMKQEGGKLGQTVRNKNGTYDHGIFQINTIWLGKLKSKLNITRNDLINNPCKSANAAAYILSLHLTETNNIWSAMGNYHNKKPIFKNKYLSQLKKKVNF